MRVTIDHDVCQGHGRCFTIAPHLFESDELGNGVVVGDGVVPAGERAPRDTRRRQLPRGCRANRGALR